MNRIKMRYVQAMCLLGLLTGIALRWLPRRRPLWIVGERGTDARDNGKWFFLWLKEQQKPVDAVYFLTADSPDRAKMQAVQDSLVCPRTFRAHYLLGCCDLIVSTQWRFYRYVSPLFMGSTLGQWLLEHFKRKQVFLQHGICKNMIRSFTYAYAPFDLFICGAKREEEYIKAEFGFPVERVIYTGLCRFDQLYTFTTKRQILIMPTWRTWFNGMSQADFNESEYCRTYCAVLQNKELHDILETEGLQLVFFPHHDAQRYIGAFTALSLPANITIAHEREYDVQQLMKESLLMVTDYSSVYFDFAYMRKPFIHFMFDKEEYDTKHYQPGFYDFENGLGYSCHDIASLIATIKLCTERNFVLDDEYRRRIDAFFPPRNTDNCRRVYEAITTRL